MNWENAENTAEPDSDEVATLAQLYGLSSRDLRFAELVKPKAAIVADPRHGPSTMQEPADGMINLPVPGKRPAAKKSRGA